MWKMFEIYSRKLGQHRDESTTTECFCKKTLLYLQFNDWSKACGSMCSKMFNRQNQTGKGLRQGRDINNTRQKSGSQAQVQSSKVGQSGVKHRDIK